MIDEELLARARAVLAGKSRGFVQDAHDFATELLRLQAAFTSLEAIFTEEPLPLATRDATAHRVSVPFTTRVTHTSFGK